MSQENYTQEIFNQQLIVEASGHMVGLPGKVAYSLLSQTKDGVKYNQTLSEGSGLSRVYAEKTLQVECGFKNKENEHSYKLIAHKGNCDFNADKGKILQKAKQITLQAAEEIVLQAPKIRIGYDQPGSTDEVLIYGSKVHVDEKGLKSGNIADLLKKSSMFKAFSSSMIAGGGMLGGGGLGGAIGGLGGGNLSLGILAQTAATAYGGPVAGAVAGQLLSGEGLDAGSLAGSVATAYGGPVAGAAVESAVNQSQS